MNILGISAYYHDSAAAIIKDGQIVAAAQEERFSRIKNDNKFPGQSVRHCLEEAGLKIDELDAVVYYEKPFLKFERLLESYYAFAPKGISSFIKSIPLWLKEKIYIKRNIRNELKKVQSFDVKKLKLLFTEHHLSHAASAYFPSGFNDAAILTIDGVGEFASTTISKGTGNKIEILKEIHFPHSVGLLYSAFTYFLGFKVNSDEYKLMGLAPYGNPFSEQFERFYQLITTKLIRVFDDGSIHINQHYFDYGSGLKMIHEKRFEKLFGFVTRKKDEDFKLCHLDCALAIQHILEEIVLKLAKHAFQLTNSRNLCLAGGVALNCVANGKIQKENIFENIFIQPAAGDAGGALGAALAGYHIYYNKELSFTGNDKMKNGYLGPGFAEESILTVINSDKPFFKKINSSNELCDHVAKLIKEGNVVGWFQGRMEFGPRSLGNRSILADARNPDMQQKVNHKIKFREGFRPFAPVVLAEDAPLYFDLESPSPYMLLVQKVKEEYLIDLPSNFHELPWQEKLAVNKSKFPAITHVDLTARIQTVSAESNPLFYSLLSSFKNLTGHGLLLNTSFNIKDEPVVCTPQEAFDCFMKTGLDYLIIDHFIFAKQTDK